MNSRPSIALNGEAYHNLWSLGAIEEEIAFHLLETNLKSEPEYDMEMLIQFWKAHLQDYLLVYVHVECDLSNIFVEIVNQGGGIEIICALSAKLSPEQLEAVNFDLEGRIRLNPFL